jgi:hypothetical protein
MMLGAEKQEIKKEIIYMIEGEEIKERREKYAAINVRRDCSRRKYIIY